MTTTEATAAVAKVQAKFRLGPLGYVRHQMTTRTRRGQIFCRHHHPFETVFSTLDFSLSNMQTKHVAQVCVNVEYLNAHPRAIAGIAQYHIPVLSDCLRTATRTTIPFLSLQVAMLEMTRSASPICDPRCALIRPISEESSSSSYF